MVAAGLRNVTRINAQSPAGDVWLLRRVLPLRLGSGGRVQRRRRGPGIPCTAIRGLGAALPVYRARGGRRRRGRIVNVIAGLMLWRPVAGGIARFGLAQILEKIVVIRCTHRALPRPVAGDKLRLVSNSFAMAPE
jgi:hypothetical protein